MIERARVLQNKASTAVVQLEVKDACRRCVAKSSCKLADNNFRQMEAANEIQAGTGDLVEVEIASGDIIKKSFLLYLAPAVFFVAGMAIALAAGLSEWLSLAAGAVLLIIAFFLLALIDKKYSRGKNLMPRIVKIIKKAQE